MTYSDKKLVAVGCSHTYGTFLDQHDPESCHNRSWVKKLEKIAGFNESINLAIGGSSNKRSIRVIIDFVLKNINNIEDYVIMIGLTEPSRTELPSEAATFIPQDIFFDSEENGYHINMLGGYLVGKTTDPIIDEFLKIYYGMFSVDRYSIDAINRDMFLLHILLKNYNVEHYFPIILGPPKFYSTNLANETIPYIKFGHKAIVTHTKDLGYPVGRDINSNFDCNHFDHEGNQFIAEGIYKHMKGYCNGV